MKWSPVVFLLGLACTDTSDPTDVNPTDPTSDTGSETVELENQLINGDAELCALTGWTPSEVGTIDAVETQDQGQAGPVVKPFEGSCFFSFAVGRPGGTEHSMTQEGLATPGTTLRLSGQLLTLDETAFVAMQALDDNDGVLQESASSGLERKKWSTVEQVLTVPEGATEWRVILSASLQSGSFTNVYFDDLSLVEVPPSR